MQNPRCCRLIGHSLPVMEHLRLHAIVHSNVPYRSAWAVMVHQLTDHLILNQVCSCVPISHISKPLRYLSVCHYLALVPLRLIVFTIFSSLFVTISCPKMHHCSDLISLMNLPIFISTILYTLFLCCKRPFLCLTPVVHMISPILLDCSVLGG